MFPILLALGGKIEVRSSWAGYLHEFRAVTMALLENDICSKQGDEADIRDVEQIEEESSLTNFEAKYQQVEQPIFRLRMDVGGMREGLYLQPNLQRLE